MANKHDKPDEIVTKLDGLPPKAGRIIPDVTVVSSPRMLP